MNLRLDIFKLNLFNVYPHIFLVETKALLSLVIVNYKKVMIMRVIIYFFF